MATVNEGDLRGRVFANDEEAKNHLRDMLRRWPRNYIVVPEEERLTQLAADAELGRCACVAEQELRRLEPVIAQLSRASTSQEPRIVGRPSPDAVSPGFRAIAEWVESATAVMQVLSAAFAGARTAKAAYAALEERALPFDVRRSLADTRSEFRMMVVFAELGYGAALGSADLEALALWLGLRHPTIGTLLDQDDSDGPAFSPEPIVAHRRAGRWSNLKHFAAQTMKKLRRALNLSGD